MKALVRLDSHPRLAGFPEDIHITRRTRHEVALDHARHRARNVAVRRGLNRRGRICRGRRADFVCGLRKLGVRVCV